jgi:hypothetical protein
MAKIILKNDTEPTTPASGDTAIYIDSVTKELKTKNDAGTVSSYLQDPLTTKGDLMTRTACCTVRLGVGTACQVLTVCACAAPGVAWKTPASGFADPLTTAGDIMIRNACNTTTRLGIGTAGQRLEVTCGIPAWATVAAAPCPIGTIACPDCCSAILTKPILHDSTGLYRFANISSEYGKTTTYCFRNTNVIYEGWNSLVSGGSVTYNEAGTCSRLPSLKMGSGTTTPNNRAFIQKYSRPRVDQTNIIAFEVVLCIPTLGCACDDFNINVGFRTGATIANGADGAFFSYDPSVSPNIRTHTANSSVRTINTTCTAWATGLQNLRVVIDNSLCTPEARYYYNDALIDTVTTNLPTTTATTETIGIAKRNNGATEFFMFVESARFDSIHTTARW